MYVGHRDNVTEVITIWRRRIWSIRRSIHNQASAPNYAYRPAGVGFWLG